MRLGNHEPLALTLVEAIRAGDLASLRGLLARHPGLAAARIEDARGGSRTPLHVATDWPGHFPNGPAVVAALIDAGADPDARCEGRHGETPLHWVASSDDVELLDVLIDAGADLEAPDGSIGTPLDNAVGYGCWQVGRRLVERGARVERLWHAAALGMTSRLEELFASTPPPAPEEVDQAFWHACQGGQRRTAEYLLARGADPSWVPPYNRSTCLEIAGTLDARRETLITWLRERTGQPAGDRP